MLCQEYEYPRFDVAVAVGWWLGLPVFATFEDASVYAVTMFDLIEHVPDDALARAEARRVLRPDGGVLVSTPLTWLGYALHRPHGPGSETASAWRVPEGKSG